MDTRDGTPRAADRVKRRALQSIFQPLYGGKIVIDDLAAMAGMSTSTFHRAFKEALSDSPLQYLKKIRLNQAKQLITTEGLAAGTAAYRVGYESPAQFSREFKRYFGLPPSQATNLAAAEPN